MTQMPPEAIIVGDDGMPIGHIDLDRVTTDATLLMYDMAATAGDDDATDKVAMKWAGAHDPDYFGYLCASALSLMTRHILGPTLEVTDRVGVDLRTGLKQASAEAHRNLQQ